MNHQELAQHCIDVARLASKNKGYYGNLVFPQRRNDRPVIREPEIRDIFGRHLMLELVLYGIEVPTNEKYSFSSEGSMSARTDLAIFDTLDAAAVNRPAINIEFKEGQPSPKQIEKDWEKLLREPVGGSCFFHVLQNSNRKTMETLLEKHKVSYSAAKEKVPDELNDKWFLFFAVTIVKAEYYLMSFPSIKEVSFDDLFRVQPAKL